MAYLKFISDENLISAIATVVAVIENADLNTEENLHKNVIDPFSALFQGVTHTSQAKLEQGTTALAVGE